MQSKNESMFSTLLYLQLCTVIIFFSAVTCLVFSIRLVIFAKVFCFVLISLSICHKPGCFDVFLMKLAVALLAVIWCFYLLVIGQYLYFPVYVLFSRRPGEKCQICAWMCQDSNHKLKIVILGYADLSNDWEIHSGLGLIRGWWQSPHQHR